MTSLFSAVVNFILKMDFIPALLIRLFLAPVLIISGYNKLQLGSSDLPVLQQLQADPNTIAWFGNQEWGLGLPYPELLANLAAWTEFLGGWLLVVGLAVRLVSIPLMVTMFVAALTVHMENGWFAITPTNPDTSAAKVLDWAGFAVAEDSLENSREAGKRLDRMKSILEQHGNTQWLYGKGNIVILNNGIEFASTYFIMLMALFFIGPGRWFSLDYWYLQGSNHQPKTE
ncbi:HvfX family Cu-binding RiPP maturation protein [Thalassotalea mangrovi]|uniref:DoxX family protein n=1 Tax=Thalassotalea mangrovi TaxID=2572245 RepID=A0A4U1B5D2_9GAMM|nr:DoxX family protein [Thalassotalea mangrovi]TKB44878.1 DoxX family protein [Thalassotalea mangrovi]